MRIGVVVALHARLQSLVSGKISSDDERKLSYALGECAGADPFPCSVRATAPILKVCACCCVRFCRWRISVWQAIDWISSRSGEAEMKHREDMVSKLEEADRLMRRSGACNTWFDGADEHVKQVAGGANGALFEELLVATGYVDVDCVSLLRGGVHDGCCMFPHVSCTCLSRTRCGHGG